MFQSISVVIPAYNAALTIGELIAQLIPVLDLITPDNEIILIDDDSPDTTWQVIQQITKKYSRVRAIQLMKNSGQAAATLCGLCMADKEIIITMDDDLQHQPQEIPALLTALGENPNMDCVFGVFNKKQHRGYRNAASVIIAMINRQAFGLPRHVKTSGFRVMRCQLAKEMVKRKTANPSIPALLLGCTRKVMSLPVTHAPRFAGESNYTLTKQFRMAFDNLCNATMLPLRLVSMCGMGLCLMSLGLVSYYFFQYLFGVTKLQGWTTLVLMISFFSGTILLSLGILGEYLVRVLREVSHKPAYVIRQQGNSHKD